jgi:hypothetical protein
LTLRKKNKSPTANETEQQYLPAEEAIKTLEWKRYNILEEALARKRSGTESYLPSATWDGVRNER